MVSWIELEMEWLEWLEGLQGLEVLKLELGLELELEWQPRPPGHSSQLANKFLMQIWPVLDPGK